MGKLKKTLKTSILFPIKKRKNVLESRLPIGIISEFRWPFIFTLGFHRPCKIKYCQQSTLNSAQLSTMLYVQKTVDNCRNVLLDDFLLDPR